MWGGRGERSRRLQEKINDEKNRILESNKFQLPLTTGDPGELILSGSFLGFNNTQSADKRIKIREFL